MVTLPTDKLDDIVLLAYTINDLYALSKALPEVLSYFPDAELELKTIAISYTTAAWESKVFKAGLFEDSEAANYVRSAFLDDIGGRTIWNVQLFLLPKVNETKELQNNRIAELLERLSSIVGCKVDKMGSFLAYHFLPVIRKAVQQDVIDLGIQSLGFYESVKARRVCLEAEKILFAPASERKDFIWFDKKFEKKGLRTWWPKE